MFRESRALGTNILAQTLSRFRIGLHYAAKVLLFKTNRDREHRRHLRLSFGNRMVSAFSTAAPSFLSLLHVADRLSSSWILVETSQVRRGPIWRAPRNWRQPRRFQGERQRYPGRVVRDGARNQAGLGRRGTCPKTKRSGSMSAMAAYVVEVAAQRSSVGAGDSMLIPRKTPRCVCACQRSRGENAGQKRVRICAMGMLGPPLSI